MMFLFYTVETLKAMKSSHESRFLKHPYPMSRKDLDAVLSSIDDNLAQIAKNTHRSKRSI